jgi:type IV pilus assembly protein PilB
MPPPPKDLAPKEPAAPRPSQGQKRLPPAAPGRGGRLHLGEMLLHAGVINQAKLDQALSMSRRTGDRLGSVLVKNGFVRPEEIARALANQFRLAFVDPPRVQVSLVDRELVKRAGVALLKESKVLPIRFEGRELLLLSDPLDTHATDSVEAVLGKREYALTTTSAIEMILQIISFESVDADQIVESARDGIDAGEVNALLQYILAKAVLEKASDVHIEPTPTASVVRYRVDGNLKVALSVPRSRHENLTNVIFGMAGVDLSDFGRLHDGRFSFSFAGRNLDIRFASSPTIEGPMMVMRILDDTRSLATLEELGYAQWNRAAIDQLLRFPFGLVLVVGPTGSGKTTTLYSCLSRINDGATKILTVEDPVEIRLPSIQQVQVNEKAEVTFARAVRAFLRQDPDVILVGEIRDEETAREAFRAANTGHLVFSTLHANSAVEAIGRLFDLGMDPYQVATTLIGCLSQRLMRKLCRHCATRTSIPPGQLLPEVVEFGFPGGKAPATPIEVLDQGPGCARCGEGFAGRTVIAEVMQFDRATRELVHARSSNQQIVKAARGTGFRTMADNAFALMLKGDASLKEVETTVGPITAGRQARAGT